MDVIVDKLADYACGLTYEALPADVVERAKHLIIDAIGCALGAAGAEPVRIAQSIAAETGSVAPGKAATTLVQGHATSPDMAAFVNGSMIRYLDFNDTYTGHGTVHPSDMVAPALAVAEAFGLGGNELIVGTVLGYETLCALTDDGIMEHPLYGVLWDQSAFAAVSAAAVAARLMRLTRAQAAHAITLAITSHLSLCQVRVGEVSHWKGCAVANASRNAVFCARLAAKGMTGPVEVFEGERGFFKAAGKGMGPLAMGGPGQPFRIMRARIKAYPSGYFSQSAIEAALELRPHIGSISEVQSVRLETFKGALEIMGRGESRWTPETRESADHSLPFTIAMALLHGDLEIRHYDEEEFRKTDVRALMQRIEVVLGEESERAWPAVPLNVLHLTLRNGQQLSARVAFHVGHFERPMTDAQQQRKFEQLARRAALPLAKTNRLLAALRAVESAKDLRAIVAMTQADS